MSRLQIDYRDPNGHIAMNSFGLMNLEDNNTELDKLIRTLGVVRPVIAELMSRRAFYQDYGLASKAELEDPLAIVKYNPKLDIVEGGHKRSYMRRFVIHGLKDLFGISWNEFLETPYSDAKFMIEMAEKAPAAPKDRELEKLLKDTK